VAGGRGPLVLGLNARRSRLHGSGERDRSGHDDVTREARDHDGGGCLERLVATKLSRLELLSHAELDLALRGYTEILQELPDRHC